MSEKSKKNNKFYITTTIPYVNALPHLGHAMEFVEADFIARFHRSKGEEVYFLSGSDENAIKNVQAAENEGINVQQLVDRNSKEFIDLIKALNISTDQFIRTTEERHFLGTQALWKATEKDIYKKSYEGLYCLGCELFYEKNELNEEGECYEHPGKKIELVEEENYFFKLSNYEEWLRNLITIGELKILPEVRKNEILSLINSGLKDFSVSRPVSRSKSWGVPVPGDESQTIYVWYDALSNYINALGYPNSDSLYQKFWLENENRVHILGKGVSRFHAIYWPAMLKSAGIPIPTLELVHGYITVDGQKMSKSTGNVINPSHLISKYGAEAVRYYLLTGISSEEDGDFSYSKFETKYTSDLTNGLGNFASRILAMASEIEFFREKEVEERISLAIRETKSKFEIKVNEFKLHEAVTEVWKLIQFGDSYINENKPWSETDREKKETAIYNAIVILDNVASLVFPALPESSRKITSCINWESEGLLKARKTEPIFPRLESNA